MLLLMGLSGCATDGGDSRLADYERLEAERLQALAADREVRRKALLESFPGAAPPTLDRPDPRTVRRASSAASHPAFTPKTYQAWRFTGYPDPLDGTVQCALVSEPHALRNGALETSVRVVVTTSQTFLRTDATLDIAPPAAGLQVDAEEAFAFDKALNDVTAVVTRRHDALVEQLRTGQRLRARFAYQPQHGGQTTHQIGFSLAGFDAALTALVACADTISGDTDKP